MIPLWPVELYGVQLPEMPPCFAAGREAPMAVCSTSSFLKYSGWRVGATMVTSLPSVVSAGLEVFSSSGRHVHMSTEGSSVPGSPPPRSDPCSVETVHLTVYIHSLYIDRECHSNTFQVKMWQFYVYNTKIQMKHQVTKEFKSCKSSQRTF